MFSLTLNRGENAAILGPSGSGKSTLLSIIGALEPPSSGRVVLDGQNPAELAEPQLAALRNRKNRLRLSGSSPAAAVFRVGKRVGADRRGGAHVAGGRRSGPAIVGSRGFKRPAYASPGRTFRRRAAAGGPWPGH